MKQTIEDIRKLFADNAFKDEQHVRFSLVGRICQKLGWDIWNPKEFYTEYPVKRYPPQEVTADLRGRVDVALILPEKNSDIAEVFIEIKTPYKLQNELVAGEIQLKRYNWWDKSAISVLTDGVIWRFYLPSVGGAFENSLFSEIDLLHDDIESICTVFDQVLRRDNFRKQAVESAENIYDEISRIKKLHNVKTEAEDIAKKTGLSKYTLAAQILKNQHNYDMDVSEIERLWDKKIPKVTQAPVIEKITVPQPHPLSNDYVETFISARGVIASGCYNIKTKQFTLYKGSEVALNHSSTFKGNYLEKKKKMIESGLLQLDPSGTKYILAKDTVFNAPSPASHLVLGRASSGYVDWVDNNGIKLDKYRLNKINPL